MNLEALIADITKCHRYPPFKLAETLDKVDDELQRRAVSEDSLFILGRADQKPEVEGRFPQAKWHFVSGDENDAPQLALTAVTRLLEESLVGRFGRVAILTFNRPVLTEVMSLPDLLVDTKPFAAVPKRDVPRLVATVVEGEQQSSAIRKSFAMEDLIKRRGFGPYSRHRRCIWDELKERFPREKDRPFGELFRDCVEAGLKAIEVEKTPASATVRDALTKLLARAQVLKKADGEFLRWGLNGSRSPMAYLEEDFQKRADAELVLLILEGMSPIAFSDRREIAGALYHSQQAPAVKDVEDLLGYLVDEGKVEEFDKDDESWFRLARPSSSRQGLPDSNTSLPFIRVKQA